MLSPEIIKELIDRNRLYFFRKEEFLLRDVDYVDLIKSPQITVITGVRRCGKSVLLKLISQRLPHESVYYLNFNDPLLINAVLPDLEAVFEEYFRMYPSKNKFLFLDEVQEVDGWHKLVLHFYNQGFKLFITGSNGNLLSREISTYLTGRHKQVELFPFSFKEFLELRKVHRNKKKAFIEYFKTGGFPLVLKTGQLDQLQEYYESIIYRDVIVRNKVSYAKELKELSFFLLSNNTKLLSYNKLKATIGVKSLSTIKEYLDYLSSSFLFFTLNRYSSSVRAQIKSSKKIYCIDNGFINLVSFKNSSDNGRLLENVVFLELKRTYKDIFFFHKKSECDFLIRDGLIVKKAIQVCFELTEENKSREFGGLLEALKEFNLKEGLLLTYDKESKIVLEDKYQITIMPVWKWLLI